jgi:hypothetical protein
MEDERNNPSTSTDSWVGKGATSGLEGSQTDRDRGMASGMSGGAQSTDTGAFKDWETSANPMIASNRVEGTAVYNTGRERLGTIQHIMIDKLSGQSEFAVMSFGGFLGIGSDYYPIPWNKLTYDTDAGGYMVDMTQEQLTGAPRYGQDENPDYNADYTGEIGRYYGL